ncbi:ladderlectin [Triplophysa rosa]|uniref:Galactose-specific lectin nattectin n=1 Tax=Triplophysa rosa TaxID=992332 RepID=A0A9W8C932_TRIRA|nr:ladderlectin [Triplophysa rosa]KAI7811197.1 putative galactose-specific lectin nattectin [Triplophysa rosa]
MWKSASLLCFVLVLNEVSGVNSEEPIMGRKCPSGWQKFGSQCFKFFKEQKTWAEAEQHCIELGGNLASIHSQLTHNYLKSLVKREAGAMTRTWIGGHDATQDFIWFWSDGSRFVYKDWHTGEPNNAEGAEKCLEMGYGEEQRWNDAPCSTKLFFLCYRASRIEF